MNIKLTSKSVFYIMVAVLILVLLGGVGVVAFGNVLLQKKSADVVSLKLENRVLD